MQVGHTCISKDMCTSTRVSACSFQCNHIRLQPRHRGQHRQPFVTHAPAN